MRAMSYDRAANESNSVVGLHLLDAQLRWHRLDDGVMGGQSETILTVTGEGPSTPELNFAGQINTDGGGFCSVRSPVPEGIIPADTTALRIGFLGDGKTYKILISDGTKSSFGPSRRSPSWQVDLPTTMADEGEVDEVQTVVIPLDAFSASLQGGPVEVGGALDPASVREIGFMLSLKLSNGDPNPVETYGSGIFPFSLRIRSIEPVNADEVAASVTGLDDTVCNVADIN